MSTTHSPHKKEGYAAARAYFTGESDKYRCPYKGGSEASKEWWKGWYAEQDDAHAHNPNEDE